MIKMAVSIPQGTDLEAIESAIEEACAEENLHPTLRDTLEKYPGSILWNFNRPRRFGTVSLVFWPQENRFWIVVPDEYVVEWMEPVIPRLKKNIEKFLKPEENVTGR